MSCSSGLPLHSVPHTHALYVHTCQVTSVVPNSVWSHGLWPTRLLCPWCSPGKNTGVGCHAFLQGIFPTQGWNPGLLHHLQAGSLSLAPPEKPPSTHNSSYLFWCLCLDYRFLQGTDSQRRFQQGQHRGPHPLLFLCKPIKGAYSKPCLVVWRMIHRALIISCSHLVDLGNPDQPWLSWLQKPD